MMEALLDRVLTRLSSDEQRPKHKVLVELITTVSDRICLRLGISEIPMMLESIVVDATIKLVRRQYFEGISNEDTQGSRVYFVENILNEYTAEFDEFRRSDASGKKIVRFL